uniref:Putative cytochrome oxidase c subunit vib n=1 Tax=Panstrongylus megistus TaxID=65343 RepID=A0A069DMD0_9HEMI
MSFPQKETRESCWNSRDKYWECLDSSSNDDKHCAEFRKLYEAKCPAQWVKHFDRKRSYIKFKERMEKEGYDPLN